MTRDEMENIIIKALRDIDPDRMGTESTWSTRFDARYILDKILEAGMLPPGRVRMPGDKDWDEKFLPVPFVSNTWEPEE